MVAAALDDWFRAPDRKPLVLRGARQVGQTLRPALPHDPVSYRLLSLPPYLLWALAGAVAAVTASR